MTGSPPDDMSDFADSPIQPVVRKRWRFRTLVGLILGGAGLLAAAALTAALLIVVPVDQRLFRAALTEPLVIFRKSGDRLTFVSCLCEPTLQKAEVPRSVADALIATEDRRFFEHHGVDPLSLLGALASGGRRGGSTIEMQLAKNTLSGDAHSIGRKLVDMLFALRISFEHPKDEVIRLYLSRVNFGRAGSAPITGLRAASLAWFGREPERLSVAQSAILVAMINAPSQLQPLRAPDALGERARLVIRRMQSEGYLPEDADVDVAGALPDRLHVRPERDRFLEDQVMREVREKAPDLPDGTHFAITTVDPIAQVQAHRIVRRAVADARGRGVRRAGLITLDARGRILAMVGGLDYGASTWNLATQGRRQAASTAKIATYLAAIEAGRTAKSTVDDRREAIQSKFVPRNNDGVYRGQIPLERCLRESRNVCTLWLAERVGFDRVSQMSARLGLTEEGVPGSSIVLGAAETTLARNAAAYLAVANGGRLQEPFLLRGVLGRTGRVLYRGEANVGHRVITAATARAMTALLAEVTDIEGTGTRAQFEGSKTYGKTGTSQDFRDAWFVGFAGHGIVTAVWVGPAEGRQMKNVTGGSVPAEIFAKFNVNLVERFQGYVGLPAEGPESYRRDLNVP